MSPQCNEEQPLYTSKFSPAFKVPAPETAASFSADTAPGYQPGVFNRPADPFPSTT